MSLEINLDGINYCSHIPYFTFFNPNKVVPDETEDKEEAKIAIIWDFKQTLVMTGAAVQPVDKPADNMAAIARLAFDTLLCNCTNFPTVGNVMITPSAGLIAQQMQNLDISALADEYVDLDDEYKDESEEGNDDKDDETETEMEQLYTELIQLKGSSFHATFQNNLKQCKERLIEKQSDNVRLHFEPANVRDENVIVV